MLASVPHTCPVHFDPEPKSDKELGRAMLRLAERNADRIGVDVVDYLAGILEGRFERLDVTEVGRELERMRDRTR